MNPDPAEGTAEGTTPELFREGSYYLIENKSHYAVPERNSVIIHECPKPPDSFRKYHIGLLYKTFITQPQNLQYSCMRCGEEIPEAVKSLFMLHNFDSFANDSHVTSEGAPW